MHLSVHAAASAGLGSAIYAATGSHTAALSCALGGTLIDVDHVADFLRLSGQPFSVSRCYSWCNSWNEGDGAPALYCLHSWELLTLLLLAAIWLPTPWLLGLVCGIGLHLAIDQFGNLRGRSKLFYFLFYRWRNRA